MTKGAATALGDTEVYYDPFDYEIDANVHAVWKRLRDERPLYYNERYDFYALSRFEDVYTASRNAADLTSGHGTVLNYMLEQKGFYKGILLFSDAPEHVWLRGLVHRLFTPRRIADLEARVTEVASRLLDAQVGRESFDAVDDFGGVLPAVVMCSLLGLGEGSEDAIRRMFDAGHHIDEDGPHSGPAIEGVAEGEDYESYGNPQLEQFVALTDFHEAAAQRRVAPRDDVLSFLLHAEVDDGSGPRPLTTTEVLTWMSHLAGAGVETVARLLSFAAVILHDNPDQRDLLVADPGLIPNAVEELLRYEAPSPVNGRWVERDVQFCGETIPAGSKLLLLNGSAGRDEREFVDPDRFDVCRTITRHLAFGVGPHFCLGVSLARLEARIALAELLRRFPRWEIDPAELVPVHTSHVRGYSSVPLHVA